MRGEPLLPRVGNVHLCDTQLRVRTDLAVAVGLREGHTVRLTLEVGGVEPLVVLGICLFPALDAAHSAELVHLFQINKI